jgi:hypothetical protein
MNISLERAFIGEAMYDREIPPEGTPAAWESSYWHGPSRRSQK